MSEADFIFISDNPPDKVVLQPITGNFTAISRISQFEARRTTHTFTIPQPDDVVIPDGVWSLNGSDWIPLGVDVERIRDGDIYFQNFDVNIYLSGDTVRVVCSNWTDSNQTIYYSVWGYSYE